MKKVLYALLLALFTVSPVQIFAMNSDTDSESSENDKIIVKKIENEHKKVNLYEEEIVIEKTKENNKKRPRYNNDNYQMDLLCNDIKNIEFNTLLKKMIRTHCNHQLSYLSELPKDNFISLLLVRIEEDTNKLIKLLKNLELSDLADCLLVRSQNLGNDIKRQGWIKEQVTGLIESYYTNLLKNLENYDEDDNTAEKIKIFIKNQDRTSETSSDKKIKKN